MWTLAKARAGVPWVQRVRRGDSRLARMQLQRGGGATAQQHHTLFERPRVKLVAGRAGWRGRCGGVEVVPEISREEETAPVPEAATAESLQRLEADAVIVAAGRNRFILPSSTSHNPRSWIHGLLTIERIPSSLLILGGGPSVVVACLFAELGTAVTIVELLPQLLPQEDAPAKQFRAPCGRGEVLVRHAWRRGGVRPDRVTVSLEGRTLTAEKMLVAVGRQPNTAGIGLEQWVWL